MADTLRCGIVGCGVIAPTHIQCFQQLGGVEVLWACDLVEDKANACATKYGIPNTTTRYEDVLSDPAVDCISICTDHASHVPISVAALHAGKHVLCEKALAAHTEGLDSMMAAHARQPDLVFSGVFQHRFDTMNQYVKDLVDREVFGTLLTAGVQMRCLRTKEYYQADRWRGTWAEEGGAVSINQAIHYIDQLVWITGGVQSLCGAYANRAREGVIETEDTSVAALRFRSGALGTIEVTSSSNIAWEPTLSFHGTKGSLDLRHGLGLKVSFEDAKLGQKIERDLATIQEHKQTALGKSYYGPSHPAQIADFVDAIREKRTPFVTARSARHTVDVVLGIYRSSHEGRWVEIDSPA